MALEIRELYFPALLVFQPKIGCLIPCFKLWHKLFLRCLMEFLKKQSKSNLLIVNTEVDIDRFRPSSPPWGTFASNYYCLPFI